MASLHRPYERRILRACTVCAHLPITEATCSLTDKWLLTITPSILTRGMLSNGLVTAFGEVDVFCDDYISRAV